MALFRRNRESGERLLSFYKLSFPFIGGYYTVGYQLASDAYTQAANALQALKEISTASLADQQSLIRAANTIIELGLEMSRVGAELVRVSNGELEKILTSKDYTDQVPGSQPGHYGRAEWLVGRSRLSLRGERSLGELRGQLQRWAHANLPAESMPSFNQLSERYVDIGSTLFSAHTRFNHTVTDINEALRKDRLIRSVASIDESVGASVVASVAEVKIDDARVNAEALSTGLDEAYQIAQRTPQLSPLSTPAAVHRGDESPGLER